MEPLSASQAVLPAIERTRQFLFEPFRWGSYLKLATIACLSEGIFETIHYSRNDRTAINAASLSEIQWTPEVTAWTLFAVISGLGLSFLFYYVILRLRFVLFHCLVHRTREIRGAWELYGRQSMRLFLANLLVWVGILLLCLVMVGGLALTAFSVLTLKTPSDKFDPGVFFILFLPCLGFAFFVAFLAIAAEVTLHDFVLPHMAIENASFRAAWKAARRAIAAEKETFFSYFILRLLLPLVAFLVLLMVAAIPLLFIGWILWTSSTGFHDMLDDAIGVMAVLRVFLAVVFGLIGAVFAVGTAMGLGGPLATWMRSYAILFYAGRYKALGELLEGAAAAEADRVEGTASAGPA